MAVGYGKLRVSFLRAAPASFSHRAIGDAVVSVTLLTTLLCIGYFGLEAEEQGSHPAVAALLLCVLAFKSRSSAGFTAWGFCYPRSVSLFSFFTSQHGRPPPRPT